MGYFDSFKKLYEEMYGQLTDDDYLLAESYSIEEDDMRLGALGSFYAGEAKKMDPEIDVDSSLEMDYAEHKNHFVMIYSDVDFGGRKFRVILNDIEYVNGRIADSASQFDRDSKEVIESVVRNYYHVLNHVNPNFDRRAYNPMEDPHEC
jgi:hypothetical protein